MGGKRDQDGELSNAKSKSWSGPRFITPTLGNTDNAQDPLHLHEKPGAPSHSGRGLSWARKAFQANLLENSETNYKILVPNFSNLPPLMLGSKYISDLIKVDSTYPSDIYGTETSNKPDSGLDNYFFDINEGLGDLSRFEISQRIDLPDRFFQEYVSTECSTKNGLFAEIDRAWIVADNKLILWNYKAPQSSFNLSSQFLSVEQKHPILCVKIVPPKSGIFVETVNHLLVIATSQSISIYLVSYDLVINNLQVFNPNLLTSALGLLINNIEFNHKTHDIYFSGEGDGTSVWRLDYSNKASFTKNKCEKICLTKSGLSGVFPTNIYKLSGQSSAQKTSLLNGVSNAPETLIQLEIDLDRGVLYTLSNKSNIRVYNLNSKQVPLAEASRIDAAQIMRSASSLFVDSANIKAFEKFKIISLQHISPKESNAVQLVAVTNFGCRVFFKLGSGSSFGSLVSNTFSSSLYSSSMSSALRLGFASIKFPPCTETPEINPEIDTFASGKLYLSQLISNQQRSQVLRNAKIAKIISPGVFLCVKRTKKSDKLFIATVNYGTLKKNNKFIEDAEFINYCPKDDASSSHTYIHDIVQLTPSMNATNVPSGYANVLASLYTKKPMNFAIITNLGIIIYQFKTADKLLRLLKDEVIESYMEDYGLEETCSVLLYLSCSLGSQGPNDHLQRRAQLLFAASGHNARPSDYSTGHLTGTVSYLGSSMASNPTNGDITYTPDQVVLSDRFYGTCLLVSRLLRDIWNENVFVPAPHIKVNARNEVDATSIKEDNVLILSMNISRDRAEFLIGSIVVLIDFFVKSGNTIPGLSAPNYSSDPNHFESEVSLRAEHIAFSAIIKSLGAIKEALSFLMVLMEETRLKKSGFDDIFAFLPITSQVNLLSLSFKSLLLPGKHVKNIIKELLSSIINKNILKGGLIDVIASSFQEKCGSFCSPDDVFIFKAIENLTRAKSIGSRDIDLKVRCLNDAAVLFEEAHASLTIANIEYAIKMMMELRYFNGAIVLLLKLANKRRAEKGPIKNDIHSIVHGGVASSGIVMNQASSWETELQMKSELYALIYKVLNQVDEIAQNVGSSNDDQSAVEEMKKARDAAYQACFSSSDKAFHYAFYQCFIDEGKSERLLDVDTPFILPFLQEKSHNNLALTNLLWLYQAKRENYYDAANILYGLVISEFDLDLSSRIEYMSRANGFCNCACPPNLRQKLVMLSAILQGLLDVANIQMDLLSAIKSDKRLSDASRQIAIAALNCKVLDASELFNAYTDPLGYFDLSLSIFKMSDYQNASDILKRWEMLFDKIYHHHIEERSTEPFYVVTCRTISSFGYRLSTSNLVFPVSDIVELFGRYWQKSIKESKVSESFPPGTIIDMFLKCRVSHERLYYVFRSLVEQGSVKTAAAPSCEWETQELVYLIRHWCAADKKLREVVLAEKLDGLHEYTLEHDPLWAFLSSGTYTI